MKLVFVASQHINRAVPTHGYSPVAFKNKNPLLRAVRGNRANNSTSSYLVDSAVRSDRHSKAARRHSPFHTVCLRAKRLAAQCMLRVLSEHRPTVRGKDIQGIRKQKTHQCEGEQKVPAAIHDGI